MKTKNNKKNSATSEIAELEAKLLAAKNKRIEEEKAARAALTEKINKLPEMLGLGSLKEVMNAIRSVNKGVSNGTSNRISDETKANIRAALTAGNQTLREIADAFNVSVPTVQNTKKDMGLVKARTPKTAAVAPASTEATPAPASV
jgi:DNA invertase Pin-like site-specific DNA recombinase